MPSRYPLFDRGRLSLEPLAARANDLGLSVVADLASAAPCADLAAVGARIRQARLERDPKAAVILMMGAHVLRSGMQRYLIDLMQRGLVSAVATNGAGAIHDFELALIGATTESVARYIKDGRFGMWRETGRLNDVVSAGNAEGLGFGEALGREILEGNYPHKDLSLFAQAYRLGVPVTVHVGLGHDIVHAHPNCDGAAVGAASYRDFLIFARCLEELEGGVVMNFGSAVMGPEVYLKALAMVRNAARGQGRRIADIMTLVCDLHLLPQPVCREAEKDHPLYFFRPWKTMLVRTVADGGRSYYVQGPHAETIPQLWTAATRS
jgi:hypothetical protein